MAALPGSLPSTLSDHHRGDFGPPTNINGKSVNEGIESGPGGTMMTGDGIEFYRLLTLRQALQMHPMKMAYHMPAATTLARRMLGIKGNKDKLLQQVNDIIDRIQAERREDHISQ